MEINKLFSELEQATSRMRLKEINEAVENLKINNSDLTLFLQQNNVKCSIFDIVSTLVDQQMMLHHIKIPVGLVKNIYDQYSIIYIISMLCSTSAKAERNKLIKIFRDVITNSAKFDIYSKVVKNNKLVSSADSQTIELFWLIPLFSNVSVLTKIDYNKFISEMKLCSIKSKEFIFGYSYYVTNNHKSMDKEAYKLFLVEGMKLLKT